MSQTLIQYNDDLFGFDWEEDENHIKQDRLELDAIHKLFDILTIPINKNITLTQARPPNDMYQNTDLDKMKTMSKIFNDMFNEYIDIS
jgi:hypothetical protein